MSVLWSELDWTLTHGGWLDPCHPSALGLSKYKRLVWDAMGHPEVLSIKVLEGWYFTTQKNNFTFESYGR